MKRAFLALTALAVSLIAMPGVAKDTEADTGVVYLRAAPASLDSAFAYLLMRVSTAKSGLFPIQQVLVRKPSAEELDAYRAAKQAAFDAALPKLTKEAKDGVAPTIETFAFDYRGKPNSFVVGGGKFLEDGAMRTVLVQVPAGTYISYGVTLGNRGLVTCNCLGTVSFVARAGVITDVGSLYADKVHKGSPVPHLEDDLGPQMFQYGFVLGAALVPVSIDTPVPASLRAFSVEPARFTAVGQYYEPGAAGINRLAPIPGILAYADGRPVDPPKDSIAK